MKTKGGALTVEGQEPIELETCSVVLATNDSTDPALGPECAIFEADFTMSPKDIVHLRLMLEPVPPWLM